MRIATAIIVPLAFAAASPAFAQSFVGEWTATADVSGATVSESVIVTQNGDGEYEITGALLPGQPGAGGPEAGPGVDIAIDGDNFSYKRMLGEGANAMTIEYSGTVNGDTFTGVATTPFGQIPYNGVRN